MKGEWQTLFALFHLTLLITTMSSDQTIFDKKLIQRRPEYEDILSHHSQFDKHAAQRRENPSLETLAFVTPWNNHGYDIVKWFRKFTMVSPVWYNIRRVDVGKYEISGEHDVDKGWMDEVRGFDSEGKVVGRILPRFAVERWDTNAVQELAQSKEAGEELTRIILEQVTKHDFDGIVVELAIPQFFQQFLANLADSIHSLPGNKRMVVVIPPYLTGYPSAEVLFNPNIHIDFFCLMTYDHNAASTQGAPNAPLEWVENQITHFIGNKSPELRAKLLVGLNMYGTLFNPSRRPIIGNDYIQLLEKYKPQIEWDSENEEAFWEFTDVEHGIAEAEVWFPSLYSIKKRLSLVEDYDVGGVSLWEVGQGLDYFYELL